MRKKTSSRKPHSGQIGSRRARPKVSGSSTSKRRRLPALRGELERAAADLSHTSESDYPFRFFSLPAEGESDLTPQGFFIRLGFSQQLIDDFNVPVDKWVEERKLDDFFPNADDLASYYGSDPSDPKVVSESKRFQILEAVLRKRLRDVKVLRVGQVEIRCYIAGLDEHGDIAGLITTAVET